jgi:hypothetical protein
METPVAIRAGQHGTTTARNTSSLEFGREKTLEGVYTVASTEEKTPGRASLA